MTLFVYFLLVGTMLLCGFLAYHFHKQGQPKDYKKSKSSLSQRRTTIVSRDALYTFACKVGGNNCVTRQRCKTCFELDVFDRDVPKTTKTFKARKNEKSVCYGCGKFKVTSHPDYVYSCFKCGRLFQKFRNFSTNLSNHVVLVIGCRTKLGHQVTLKLLRANAMVYGTTRYPESAMELFRKYEDSSKWIHNLQTIALDLDIPNMQEEFSQLREKIQNKEGRLDALIFCAAQTIRVREKQRNQVLIDSGNETNRYGDARFVKETYKNSWSQRIGDYTQEETLEVFRINALAPLIMIQTMIPLLQESLFKPFVILVHAREGLFQVNKSPHHLHTNMAKAALAMITRCLIEEKLLTKKGKKFSFHGCDPGWISIDEYYEKEAPFLAPPLDEVDGAARILFPLFKDLDSSRFTRSHFFSFRK